MKIDDGKALCAASLRRAVLPERQSAISPWLPWVLAGTAVSPGKVDHRMDHILGGAAWYGVAHGGIKALL
jgi:hypothetical protein